MKASSSPQAILFAAIFAFAASCLHAQDSITVKSGPPRQGQILGMAGTNIRIKVGPVETSVPLDQAVSVSMAAPKAYNDALAAWKTGDAEKTLVVLKPLVDTFRGLPTPWATRASALLGQVYLAKNQLSDAEAAFAAFQKAYPQSASLSDIGLAQLAVQKKDFATAKSKLEPIVAAAGEVVAADPAKSAEYGQAFYLMGVVRESEGAYPEALRDYLSAVTLFHEDQAIAAKAQERADILVKEKQVVVP